HSDFLATQQPLRHPSHHFPPSDAHKDFVGCIFITREDHKTASPLPSRRILSSYASMGQSMITSPTCLLSHVQTERPSRNATSLKTFRHFMLLLCRKWTPPRPHSTWRA